MAWPSTVRSSSSSLRATSFTVGCREASAQTDRSSENRSPGGRARRGVLGHIRGQALLDAAEHLAGHRDDDLLLRAEVQVDGARRQSRLADHVGYRRGMEPLTGEAFPCCLQDLVAAGGAVRIG